MISKSFKIIAAIFALKLYHPLLCECWQDYSEFRNYQAARVGVLVVRIICRIESNVSNLCIDPIPSQCNICIDCRMCFVTANAPCNNAALRITIVGRISNRTYQGGATVALNL